MEDQVTRLPAALTGALLNSSQTDKQRAKVVADLKDGKVDVLFVSPETAVSPWFLRYIGASGMPTVSFVCIDEVHCVSEWSHNFRPSYLRLGHVLRRQLGVRCLLGLTATATPKTQESTAHHLQIPPDGVIRGGHVPANLQLSVSRQASRRDELVRLLRSHHRYQEGAVVVYCTRQAEAEQLARALRTQGVDADSYHAGMNSSVRKKVQTRFMNGDVRVVVATIAFGMGLNKSDIRGIIHYNFPKSGENYVQEIGRAGRDGKPAFCHLFLEEDDLKVLRAHARADTVDEVSIKRLVHCLFLPAASHQPAVLAARAACAARGTTGAAMVQAAEQAGWQFAAVPVETLEHQLDMKETVITTMMTALELFPEGYLDRLPPAYTKCRVKQVLDAGMAQRDILYASIMAATGPDKRFDVRCVANAIGLEPAEVIRHIQTGRTLAVDFEEPAQYFRIVRHPSEEELDDIVMRLVQLMHTLERTQLQKLAHMLHIMEDALAVSTVREQDTVIRSGLQQYMDATELYQGSTEKPLEPPAQPVCIERLLALWPSMPPQTTARPCPRVQWRASATASPAHATHTVHGPAIPCGASMWVCPLTRS
eukprot:m.238066 g.238066  ORF g.238066 m.238066 type:complete len:594 (+) comp22505_c2_seq1:1508-3289(+)